MNWLALLLWFLVLRLIVNSAVTVARVGRPQKALTGGNAAGLVLANITLIFLIVWFGGLMPGGAR